MKNKCAALLMSLSLMLTACTGEADARGEIKLPIYGADEITYEIAEAQYMDISDTESVGAVLGYPYAETLTYPADALVTYISIANNAKVKAGDVLVELDSSELDYEISNQQTLVNAAAAARATQAGELQYQIELNKLNRMLEEKEAYTIRAPFDGIITGVKRVAEGSNITKGDICCSVSELDKIAVYIDGGEAQKFRFGQNVTVKIDGNPYEATVVAAPDVAPEGTRNANRAVFDLGEGVLQKLGEENPMVLTSGWATVFVTSERKNVLAVPDSAVKTRGSVSYVTLVDGDEWFKLYVTPGQSLGGYTEILDGISAGDIVIAEGSGVLSTSLNGGA